eukprot:TRINITY_DN13541_c0_g1_i2.p1 TRINITY_DN13541_c0_g1~~TRINITY_DN13541_c0_g1_i2.p1  ORF type:complete len:528 (+),score=102.52 TRINITY_DN13541_c0_g1_i2:58-1641(+)
MSGLAKLRADVERQYERVTAAQQALTQEHQQLASLHAALLAEVDRLTKDTRAAPVPPPCVCIDACCQTAKAHRRRDEGEEGSLIARTSSSGSNSSGGSPVPPDCSSQLQLVDLGHRSVGWTATPGRPRPSRLETTNPAAESPSEMALVKRAASYPSPSNSPRSCIAGSTPRRHHSLTPLSPRQRRLRQIESLRHSHDWEGTPHFIGSADVYEDNMMRSAFIIVTQKYVYRTDGFGTTVSSCCVENLSLVVHYEDTGFVDIVLRDESWLVFLHSETKSASQLRFLDVLRDHLPGVRVKQCPTMDRRLDTTLVQYLAKEQAIRQECESEVRKAVVNEAANEEFELTLEQDTGPEATRAVESLRLSAAPGAPPGPQPASTALCAVNIAQFAEDAMADVDDPIISPLTGPIGAPSRMQRMERDKGRLRPTRLERQTSDTSISIGSPGSSTCSPVRSPQSEALHTVRNFAKRRRESSGFSGVRSPPLRSSSDPPSLRAVSRPHSTPPELPMAALDPLLRRQLSQRSDSAPPS